MNFDSVPKEHVTEEIMDTSDLWNNKTVTSRIEHVATLVSIKKEDKCIKSYDSFSEDNVKDEKSDISDMQNNIIIGKMEPAVTLKSLKKQEMSDDNESNRKEQIEQCRHDYILYQNIKQEKLEESLESPTDVNDYNVNNAKKEYFYIKDVKEEPAAVVVHVEEKYEDSKYNIDIVEHKIESSFDNYKTSPTSVCEESILPRSCSVEKKNILISEWRGSGALFEARRKNKNECCKNTYQKINLSTYVDGGHKGLNMYKCNECHKMFSRNFSLQIHIDRVHKEIKKYECNVCSKKFTSKQSLQRHIDSVHKGIKNYECNMCSKMFFQNIKMQQHIDSVHKGIKNYECNVCSKKFCDKHTLQRHIDSVHKRIKKYECNMCRKTFSERPKMHQHIDSVHKGIKNYECDVCNRKFFYKYTLKCHIDKVHKVMKNYYQDNPGILECYRKL